MIGHWQRPMSAPELSKQLQTVQERQQHTAALVTAQLMHRTITRGEACQTNGFKLGHRIKFRKSSTWSSKTSLNRPLSSTTGCM